MTREPHFSDPERWGFCFRISSSQSISTPRGENRMEDSTEYEDFFQQATGYPPYPYQTVLANSRVLPLVLDIPTGLGKTASVTLAWIWRRFIGGGVNGVNPQEMRYETPRRLVYCLPMRVLVEQTAANVRLWLENLVKASLLSPQSKPAVHVLMGGEVAKDWDFLPEREAILIGTQDQLLSRALKPGLCDEPLPLAGPFRTPQQ
jgi:CRISPR-associated endonuclease/helicase Cas3